MKIDYEKDERKDFILVNHYYIAVIVGCVKDLTRRTMNHCLKVRERIFDLIMKKMCFE